MAEKLAPLDSGINIGAEPNTDNFPNMYNSSSDSSGSLDETQEGYDYEVVPSVDKKYECPVCLMLLRNPVQTPCGHRFCKACLKRWIKESEDARCPYDNELLEEGQIFPDNFAKREIMDMKVLCQNAKHGCRLVCELRQMELHVDVCEHRLVPCPQQCEQKVPHSQLHAHLGHECVKRLVPCQHCNASVAFDEMNHHYQHCPLVTIPCEYCAQDFIRHQMEHHLSHQCEKVSVKCSFLPLGCPVELSREDIETHYSEDTKHHLQLMCSAVTNLIGSLKNKDTRNPTAFTRSSNLAMLSQSHLQKFQYNVMPLDDDHCGNLATGGNVLSELSADQHQRDYKLSDFPKMLNNLSLEDSSRVTTQDSCYFETSNSEFSRLQQRNVNLEEKSVQQQQLILELQAKNNNLEKRLSDQDSRFKELREQIADFEARNCRGIYIWKIPKYSQLRKKAITGEASVLHSPGFYSDIYGYKICIRMNLNGVDTGQSTHLSIFVHFMQGQFDDFLEWPFQGKITLSILDQNESVCKQHITETLMAKPNLAAFQRPRNFRNHKGFGYVEFAPFSILNENSTYLKNDTLTIKAVIAT